MLFTATHRLSGFRLPALACFIWLQLVCLTAAATENVILVLGDSLSTGHKIGEARSWPALLAKRLYDAGSSMRVVNASRKGETTGGGLKRLQSLLTEYRPSLVILALGANDGLARQSPSDMKTNLANMVMMVRAEGAMPIMVGMRLPPYYNPAYAEDFAAAFAQAAEETRTPFIPFLLQRVAGNTSMFLPDRLHPNAAAQPLLLESVWPVLRTSIAGRR